MEVIPREVFPTLFYEFIFSQDQIIPLCEEIQDKKEELKRRYYNDYHTLLTHSEPILDDYWTDYVNPITLVSLFQTVLHHFWDQIIAVTLTITRKPGLRPISRAMGSCSDHWFYCCSRLYIWLEHPGTASVSPDIVNQRDVFLAA